MFSSSEQASISKIFFRVDDPSDQRLGHLLRGSSEAKQGMQVQILGYPDDRGVQKNGGRAGASLGPESIRKILYLMTPTWSGAKLGLADLGNLVLTDDLLHDHEIARSFVQNARLKTQLLKTVSLGGGHDWAWPDFSDLNQPGDWVINLDAHLDMRPWPTQPEYQGHSGTAFRRLLESGVKVCTIGLQKSCTAQAHLDYASQRKVKTLFWEDLPQDPRRQSDQVVKTLKSLKARRIGLSLCMDVFSEAWAPGVSAPQAQGLYPETVLAVVRALGPKVTHFGVYETAPSLDRGSQTSRLAAKIIFEAMRVWSKMSTQV